MQDGHCSPEVMGERIKAQAKMLDEHEHRLNDHEKRIRKEEQHSGVVDESVRNMCKRVDSLTKALWAVATAIGGAVITLVFDFIRNSL